MTKVIHSDFISKQFAKYIQPAQTSERNVGTLSLEYVAEGAANVIFAIRLHDPFLQQYDNAYVLRLRKDLPFTVPTSQAIQEFHERIVPLFEEQSWILTPVPISLDAQVVHSLNERLTWMENHGQRKPESRLGVYLPEISKEPLAILLPNLYHGEGTVVEFKPKWLVQSPSAPSAAIRCRTCALNLSRREKGHARGRGDSGICPLNLLSSQEDVLTLVLTSLCENAPTLASFVNAFCTTVQPILHHLARLQNEHNQVGLDSFLNPQNIDFSVAMALRDCSVFLKVVTSPDQKKADISLVRILDLDLKQTTGGKIEKWADIEQKLIEGEWYTKEVESEYHQCALSRTPSTTRISSLKGTPP